MAQRKLKCITCHRTIKPQSFRPGAIFVGHLCPTCGGKLPAEECGSDGASLIDHVPRHRLLNRFHYGINDLELDFSGFTLAQAVEALADIMNFNPLTVVVYVDGKRVCDLENVVLPAGAAVEFMKEFGIKGGPSRGERMVDVLERLATALESNTAAMKRIADHFDPPNRQVVGSPYVAERLGRTIRWIGDLARDGKIPKSCICPGSGDGNYWKFWKEKIDEWINGL